ncbi:hypothetical protein ACQEU3_16955 [Spirillospora sp. CA-253888]
MRFGTGPGGLREHPLVRRLVMLDLAPDDFVIAGSGPLLAHRLRDQVSDLDVVARGDAWAQVRRQGMADVGTITGAPIVSFWGGLIQFCREWVTGNGDADGLIERSDMIEGVRFASLEDVLAYKLEIGRPKDFADVRLLRAHLGREAVADSARACG